MSTLLKKTIKKNFNSILKKGAYFLYGLVKPKSDNEDLSRREFILNNILLGSILLSFLAVFIVVMDSIRLGQLYRGESLRLEFMISSIFIFLYFLSRKGFFILASYILIGLYFLSVSYSAYKWGADLPSALLIYALIIIMSGILISTRVALINTAIISTFLIALTHFQSRGTIIPNLYWKTESFKVKDIIVIVIIFSVMLVISWLSNREIDKSLLRARRSEEELKKERYSLEIKVQERTRELKEAQIEKTLQLHRFAEFGKLASGIFHDLVNPLTAAILNLENLKISNNSPEVEKLSKSIEKMRTFTEAARKQLQKQEVKSAFSPDKEIKSAIETLSYKARRLDIYIDYIQPLSPINIFGDPVKFYRVICDILSNAIDAYDSIDRRDRRKDIRITLIQKNHSLTIIIRDWGEGIKKENLEKIFQPLFTTKNPEKGIGLGLAICKDIIEKDFSGKIRAESSPGSGSTFMISLPIKNIYGKPN